MILRLLGRKLGTLPNQSRSKIQGLSLGQLEELGEALLDFAGLFDLEDWLERQVKLQALHAEGGQRKRLTWDVGN